MERDERYSRAKKRVQDLKAFYTHVIVYIIVNIMIFIINFMTFDGIWWFIYPLGGWGIGIVAHGITTFANSRFGADWEERKIKEYMEKDR